MRTSGCALPHCRWLEPKTAVFRKELQIFKMALLCVGNNVLERHCSKERSEKDWGTRAAHGLVYVCVCVWHWCKRREKDGQTQTAAENYRQEECQMREGNKKHKGQFKSDKKHTSLKEKAHNYVFGVFQICVTFWLRACSISMLLVNRKNRDQ